MVFTAVARLVKRELASMLSWCFRIAFLSLFFALSAVRAQGEDEFKVGLMPITPSIEETTAKVMAGCEPLKGKIAGEINKNGVYTLTGELFHNGKTYSLIDDGDDVILCEWQKPAWKPKAALNIHTEWNFPVGYREHDGREPYEQTQPFWMLDIQNRPLLVVASWVEKAGQNYYVILFDSKCEQLLDTDSSFGLRPVVKENYLLTGDASRGKAEWGATYFSRIENNKFRVLKSWEDSVPWHAGDWSDQPDDSSNYATSDSKGFLILPDTTGNKHPADYVIVRSDPKRKNPRLHHEARLGKDWAAVYFMQRNGLNGNEPLAYIFEKLTGLSEELYPGYSPEMNEKPKSHWKIKVTGNDKEIVRLLTPERSQ